MKRKKSREKNTKISVSINVVCLQKIYFICEALKIKFVFLFSPNLHIKMECLSTITLLAPSKCVLPFVNADS